MRTSLLLCFLLVITSYCTIPPSPDFNITNFVGHWNVVGLYSTTDLGVQFYSCATLNVTLGTISRLTLTFNYINTETNSFVQTSATVVPSPINKAILISTTSPTPQNNYVVTYYNVSSGEAVIVNSALNFGYVLARDENPETNDFETTAIQILTSLSVPLSNVTFIYNKACDYQNLHALTTFDATTLSGQFYGNAVYTTNPALQDLECFTSMFQSGGNKLLEVTTNFTFSSGKIVYTDFNYYPLPQLPSVLMNTEITNVSPFVILYADFPSDTYVGATGDKSKAFVFSSQPSLSQDVLAQVQQVLNQNGLIVSSSTFYQLQTTCLLGGHMEQEVIF